ncbi:MAG: hypothetical protein FJ298_07440 [Planctomycetes bacterium]|nr:hypothetical protein [Planctomycetota bacterium]
MTTDRLASPSSQRWLGALILALTLVLGVRVLHLQARAAGDLRVTPDEVEYALCAQRIATIGRYDLELDGVATAPHSTPWFSALLAPAYWIDSEEVGAGIWVVLASSLCGLLLIVRIGERVSGPLGAAGAVIALLSTPLFPYLSRLIMTDAPALMFALATTLLYLRQREREPTALGALGAGALIALSFALRSVYVSLLTPFVWRIVARPGRRILCATCLLAPLSIVIAANAYYNHTTFGDWQRTGYQFWCAVPYDYPELLLSTDNLALNLGDLTTRWGPPALWLGAIGLSTCLWRVRASSTPFITFAALTALPISALHAVYFYADLRFHLWLLGAATALGGMGLAALVPQRWRTRRELAAVALAIACFAVPDPTEFPPLRRRTSDQLKLVTPNDALVISGLEPVYLKALEDAGSRREFMAASRDVEFASKVLSRVRVPREIAQPMGPYDHRARGLLASGSVEAHARTADEMPAEIAREVRAGRAVYLERSFLSNPQTEWRILGNALRLESPSASISRLVAR